MAIYHFTTSIIKASKGKCAIASAAYISAGKLYDERLGMTFSYTRKEEVVYTEIMLPENAPKEFKDRETLWNAVEKVQNKSNSRYARMFEMALPNELTTEEQIELARTFIQKNFVDKGMITDFALHKKERNNHIHVMTTVRGFTKSGKWAAMEKKDYARDENGNRIPIIDPATGLQKRGKKNDLQWKRVTVKRNEWNSRTQLIEWRKNWAEECNRYLPEEKHIDHRSYKEQGIEKIPTIHEGYAARQMKEKGKMSERIRINEEIRHQNNVTQKIHLLLSGIFEKFRNLKQRFEKERDENGKTYDRKAGTDGAVYATGDRTAGTSDGAGGGIPKGFGVYETSGNGDYDIKETEQRIAELKRKVESTELAVNRIKSEITERIRELNERISKYRRNASDTGESGCGDYKSEIGAVRADERVGILQRTDRKSETGKVRTFTTDTDYFLREIETEIQSTGTGGQNHKDEPSRFNTERKRESNKTEQRIEIRDDGYGKRNR